MGLNMNDINELAPICLFVYCRLKETKQTVESLQQNYLSTQSKLYIFSEGAKNETDIDKVIAVRKYIHTINGFDNVTIYESEKNKGLANSIIWGVTQIVNKYNKVIVLEDDLLLSTNFLCFMNQALNFYDLNKKIFSISGYSFNLQYPNNYKFDVAFSIRASSWGWAIWKDRWLEIDWELKDYAAFRWNILNRILFNKGGSDLSRMLDRQKKAKIDSWAIRFTFHQFKHGYFDVFPTKSKVINNGFNSESTHTKYKSLRFDTKLDYSEQRSFCFSENVCIDKHIQKQFYKHYSYRGRLKDKLMNILWKIK